VLRSGLSLVWFPVKFRHYYSAAAGLFWCHSSHPIWYCWYHGSQPQHWRYHSCQILGTHWPMELAGAALSIPLLGFTLNCPELSLSWKFGVLWEQKLLGAHEFMNNEWVMHKLYFSNSRLLRPGWEEPEANFIMDQTSVQSCVNMIWDYVLCRWDSWHDADCVCCLCWFRDMDKGQMILFRLSHLEIILANLATWI